MYKYISFPPLPSPPPRVSSFDSSKKLAEEAKNSPPPPVLLGFHTAMEGGSSNDRTVDSSVSSEDAANLDLPLTPQPTNVPRFHSKIKGKTKITGSSPDPESETIAIAGATPSDGPEQSIGGSTEVDDRDDDVVREITVFCSSGNLGQDTQLYVMQHVLRAAWRPYELDKRCEEIRLNPEQLKIEVDLRIERGDGNHDENRSEHSNIPKQTLSSTVVPSRIQYAVGFLEKNKLNLNPVHAILQLRPSFGSDGPPQRDFVLLQYYPIDSSISDQIKHRMAAEGDENVQFMMRLRPSHYIHFIHSGNLPVETVRMVPSMRVDTTVPVPLESPEIEQDVETIATEAETAVDQVAEEGEDELGSTEQRKSSRLKKSPHWLKDYVV